LESPQEQCEKIFHTRGNNNLLPLVYSGMKRTMLHQATVVNLTVVALLTLLVAGCAVAPKTENVSMATITAHTRAAFPDALQPNPSDSPEFTQWGAKKDL